MKLALFLVFLFVVPNLDCIKFNEQILITARAFFNEVNRIPVFLLGMLNLNSFLNTPELRIKNNPDPEYDFIVVGSGSAGSVIANRLSEIKHWKVLLLEAGQPEGPLQSIPTIAADYQDTDYDWAYLMEYEPTSGLGFINSRMPWPRGKALGGTSTINYMIYTRGNRYDYQRWEAAGNPGWSYEEVLPYYIKSENAKLRDADYRYHNTKGYLSVENAYRSEMVDVFIEGGNELGLPEIDYNAPGPTLGVAGVQGTVKRGKRHSAAQAFLWPIKHRKNLDILTGAFVTKILIDEHDKTAYGVQYEVKGKKYSVRSKREVVLSAGTFNSPQLLMLSGVGPAHHLQELGIPVLKDLPVGQNLQDHLCFPALSFFVNRDITLNPYRVFSPKSILSFFLNGTGPMTSLGGVEAIGYIKTEIAQYQEEYPDIELIFSGGSIKSDYGSILRRGFKIRDEIYYAQFGGVEEIPDWTIWPMLLHPKSSGYLKLQTTNPHDYPLLHGNFFTDPNNEDIKTFIASIRFIQRLSDTKAFQKLGSRMNPLPTPGCEHHPFNSDEYWECSLRLLAVTLHHQVGTCKMGPENDPGAVVNNRLQVHGVNNLRVADSSIVPFGLSAHTNAVAMMVGEKTSDIIKQDWQEIY